MLCGFGVVSCVIQVALLENVDCPNTAVVLVNTICGTPTYYAAFTKSRVPLTFTHSNSWSGTMPT